MRRPALHVEWNLLPDGRVELVEVRRGSEVIPLDRCRVVGLYQVEVIDEDEGQMDLFMEMGSGQGK